MKHLMILACVLAVSSPVSSMKMNTGINHNCIHVVSMADDMFYFKSDKDVAGASVEVYDYRTGEKVMVQVIEGKRTVINFQAQRPGDYIIIITKGDFRRKYVFHKL